MRIYEVITEARRNPTINKTLPPIQQLRSYYDNASMLSIEITNLFISLTSLEKLGINPGSFYDTPLGIFAYSVDYTFARAKRNLTELPYFGDKPYINLFKATKPVRVLILNDMTMDDVDWYVDKLKSISEYKPHIPTDTSNARVQTPGGIFWYITMIIAQSLSKIVSKKAPVLWNILFRKLGIDGCVDTGSGIIHHHESSQAVFFSMESIELIDRIPNKLIVNHKPNLTRSNLIRNTFRKADSIETYELMKDKMLSSSNDLRLIPIHIMLKFDPQDAIQMLALTGKRSKATEQVVATDPELAYWYASSVLRKKQFLLGEPAIATSAKYSYNYANDILKNKTFPAGEPAIATDAFYSYYYAYIRNRRFPAGEAVIATDPRLAADYDAKFGTNLAQR